MPLDGVMADGGYQQDFRFRLPGATDRLAVLGRTGSGKTHFAVWALSHANWTSRPWLIVDYKRDPLIAEIPGSLPHRVDAKRLPKRPGIYRVLANRHENEAVEELLWKIYQKGRTGLYVDEGHMAPDKDALQSILSQGRSKQIPVILLSQRPVWLNRFALSEASQFSVFSMNDKRDRQTVGSFLPDIDLDVKLPPRHSYYYDVARDHAFLLKPVPDAAAIFARFRARSPELPKWRVV